MATGEKTRIGDVVGAAISPPVTQKPTDVELKLEDGGEHGKKEEGQ